MRRVALRCVVLRHFAVCCGENDDIYFLRSCPLPNLISILSAITIQFVFNVFVLYVLCNFYCRPTAVLCYLVLWPQSWINSTNNNNNIHICIAPYGRNFRGAGTTTKCGAAPSSNATQRNRRCEWILICLSLQTRMRWNLGDKGRSVYTPVHSAVVVRMRTN